MAQVGFFGSRSTSWISSRIRVAPLRKLSTYVKDGCVCAGAIAPHSRNAATTDLKVRIIRNLGTRMRWNRAWLAKILLQVRAQAVRCQLAVARQTQNRSPHPGPYRRVQCKPPCLKFSIFRHEALHRRHGKSSFVGDYLDGGKPQTVSLGALRNGRGFHVDSLGLVRSRELRFLVRAGDRRKTHQDSPSEPCVGPAAVTRIHDLPDLKYLTHNQSV